MLTSKINGFSATVVRVQGQDIDICMLTNIPSLGLHNAHWCIMRTPSWP